MPEDRYYLVKINDSQISVTQVDTPSLFSKLWTSSLSVAFSQNPEQIRYASGWLMGMLHMTAPADMAAKNNPVKN